MTLFELLFFVIIVAIASIAGFYGYLGGGIWIGIGSAVGSIVLTVTTIMLASKFATLLHRSNLKCPCGTCRDNDYVWIGQDSNNNPIAKYSCGKTVVLMKGEVQEVKPQ